MAQKTGGFRHAAPPNQHHGIALATKATLLSWYINLGFARGGTTGGCVVNDNDELRRLSEVENSDKERFIIGDAAA